MVRVEISTGVFEMDGELGQKCDGTWTQDSESLQISLVAVLDVEGVCGIKNGKDIGVEGAACQEQVMRDLERTFGTPIVVKSSTSIEINLLVR